MLKIKQVSRSFMQRGIVLDNLELAVNEGDTIAITGPSGSGKTTLLNLIGLLDRPDSGDILFREQSILAFNSTESAEYRNRNIGFVFQEHLLLPHLTVMENILLPTLTFRRNTTQDGEILKTAGHLMEVVGIADLEHKYPFQISGGEAQRTALVRALINHPSILLADEPTGSLDSENARALGDLLLELNAGRNISIILATHSESLASRMKKKFRLENGKLDIL
jgi:ABC-type lipoprotein export system ATPase subunit